MRDDGQLDRAKVAQGVPEGLRWRFYYPGSIAIATLALRRLVALIMLLFAIVDLLFGAGVVILATLAIVVVRHRRIGHFDDSVHVFGAVNVMDKMCYDLVDAIGIVVKTACLLDRA